MWKLALPWKLITTVIITYFECYLVFSFCWFTIELAEPWMTVTWTEGLILAEDLLRITDCRSSNPKWYMYNPTPTLGRLRDNPRRGDIKMLRARGQVCLRAIVSSKCIPKSWHLNKLVPNAKCRSLYEVNIWDHDLFYILPWHLLTFSTLKC